MHLGHATIALLGATLLVPSLGPQDSVTTQGEEIPGTRSFYSGHLVDDPEALSGVWEASDGQGGAVGIHLNLLTVVSDDADPPAWAPHWQHLNFGVFHRKAAELGFGEGGYFGDDRRGGSVTLENGRIQFHFVSTKEDIPSVDLDLIRDANDCWQGRFHRGSFDAAVTLCRPTPGPEVRQSALVGTWSMGSSLGSSCVHIAQTGAATFAGWSDSLGMPGNTIYLSNDTRPHHVFQSYGDLLKVHLAADGQVSLELGAYSALCCSHLFTGHLSADGTTIDGNFPPGPNQYPHTGVWTKLPGDTCFNPAALPKSRPKRCPPAKN
jgi:hypothetical protein